MITSAIALSWDSAPRSDSCSPPSAPGCCLDSLTPLPDLVRDLRIAIIVYAVQVVVDQASNGCQASLDGLQRADLSRLSDGVRRTLVAVAVAAVAALGGDLPQVAVASLGASAVGLVGVALVLHRARRTWWRHRPGVEHIRELLAYGKTVAVLRPIGVIHRQMDRLVVGAILGPSGVSLVEIATQIQNGAKRSSPRVGGAVLPAASWVRARSDHSSLSGCSSGERSTRAW